jgi:exosortase
MPIILALVASCGVLWSYWSTLVAMRERWDADSLYSHGYVVPVVVAGMLWWRRSLIADALHMQSQAANEPRAAFFKNSCLSVAIGLSLLLTSVGLRMAGAKLYYEWFDGISLVPCVAGLVVLAGGLPLARAVWPAVAYLVFLVPLPFRLEAMLGGPLQSVATSASTFGLQTFGFPATAEGNVIVIGESRIGVAEACSGLRMLVVFFATTAVVALCSRKPLWERAVVLASAIPIAITCNVIRITATGVLFETVSKEAGKLVLHDFAGWLMMLLAMGFLKFELWYLSHLLVDPPEKQVIPIERRAAGKSLDRSPSTTAPSRDAVPV